MNSSTNPPNAPLKRYQFDLDFEEERVRLETLRQEEVLRQAHAAEQEIPVELPPSFSEAELSVAREESFKIGYEQGMADAKKSIERQIADISDRIAIKLRMLIENDDMRTRMAQEITLRTALATIKRTWPQILNKLGTETVEETIRQALQLNKEEARIVVRVHDSLLDEVVAALPHMKDQEAFAGKVIVLSDESVIAGDCKVEWADGGLERLSRTLSQQLDHAFEHILAGLNTQNDNVEPERTSS